MDNSETERIDDAAGRAPDVSETAGDAAAAVGELISDIADNAVNDDAVDQAENAVNAVDNAVDAVDAGVADAVDNAGDANVAGQVDAAADGLSGTETAVIPGTASDAKKKSKGKRNVSREILSWVLTILAAFIIAIFINAYVFRISRVSGNSMQQTLHDRQTVFISRVPYMFSGPKYGDIIVFDSENVPRNFLKEIRESLEYNVVTISLFKKEVPHKYFIKRVIGVAGDVIEIKEDGVYRNGERLNEDYINPDEKPNYSPLTYTVGDGEVFVMGDNRNHSSDSRNNNKIIGVKVSAILGKVINS